MKALTAVEETADDRKARRYVNAMCRLAEIEPQLVALNKAKRGYEKIAAQNKLPADHPAYVACQKRLEEFQAEQAERRGR